MDKDCLLLRKWHLPGITADATELDSGGPSRHITGSPLLVLKSVSLISEYQYFPGGRSPLYVYGHVLMIDDLGNEFYIFRRQRHDTKEVLVSRPLLFNSCSWKLPLLNQCDFQTPRCFPKSFTLHIFLMGVYDYDYDYNFNDHLLVDACLTTTFHSPQLPYFHYTLWAKSNCTGPLQLMDLCAVDYEIFRHALVSRVSISLVSDDLVEDDDAAASTAGVVGSITAKDQAGHIPSPLLDTKFEKPQKLEFGVMTELSTLAIPSSSVLSIQVNLEVNNGEDNICGSCLYEPNEHRISPLANVISGRRFKVIVFVYCAHAMRCLREYDLREWCFPKRTCGAKSDMKKWLDLDIEKYYYCIKSDANASESLGECVRKEVSHVSHLEHILGIEASAKRSRKTNREELLYINPKLRCVSPQNWYVCDLPQVLVELFCISVHWNSDEPVSTICGEINCYHSHKSFTIFNEQAYVFPGEVIQLLHPHKCLRGPLFQIHVTLEDNEGSQISNGSVLYDYHTAEGWYNRRICSIIKGKCGYAALYYTIFSDAIQAKLNFTIESKFNVGDDVDFKVYGKIVARYNNFMYCTIYDEDYYQSVLFQKNFNDAVSVLDDGGIPLSKCVVAVPLNASLLVQACIFVKIKGGYVKKLKIMAHFNPQKPNEKLIKTRHGSNYCSSVLVEWSN